MRVDRESGEKEVCFVTLGRVTVMSLLLLHKGEKLLLADYNNFRN